MPKGTALTIKCPKCRRGMWGKLRAEKGCRPTGRLDARVRTTRTLGHGAGGPSFTGYWGEVKCGDCGHVWLSSHPSSGRKHACSRCGKAHEQSLNAIQCCLRKD